MVLQSSDICYLLVHFVYTFHVCILCRYFMHLFYVRLMYSTKSIMDRTPNYIHLQSSSFFIILFSFIFPFSVFTVGRNMRSVQMAERGCDFDR